MTGATLEDIDAENAICSMWTLGRPLKPRDLAVPLFNLADFAQWPTPRKQHAQSMRRRKRALICHRRRVVRVW